jgi:hypothetical protein
MHLGCKVIQGFLRAVGVPPRSSIEDVCAPVVVTGATLHAIAAGRRIYEAQTTCLSGGVGWIHQLDVPHVAGLAKPFPREVSAAHLRGTLTAARREHLATPLNIGGTALQWGEDGRWPIAHTSASNSQPPVARVSVLRADINSNEERYWEKDSVEPLLKRITSIEIVRISWTLFYVQKVLTFSVFYLPNCNRDLTLCATIGRLRGQGTTDSNLIVCLNESWAL